MIRLLLNNAEAPATLQTNLRYALVVTVDGSARVPLDWSLVKGGTTVASGNDAPIEFTLSSAEPHTLTYRVLIDEFTPQESTAVFNVTARGGTPEVGIIWTQYQFARGDKVEADIRLYDPEGRPARQVNWVLRRNSLTVAQGGQPHVEYPGASTGVYRITATIVDSYGNTLVGDSTVKVTGEFEAQNTLPNPLEDGTMYHLGDVYTPEAIGSEGVCSALPYPLTSYTYTVFLLPGTTHVTYELEPTQNTVDDEVVVRTRCGNYALVGPPGGLNGEDIGYDYDVTHGYVPAPGDLKLDLTVDAWNVHGSTFTAHNFRVRIRCWHLGEQLYQYNQCTYSIHPGGEAVRARRWIALFSELEVQPDFSSGENRYQTGEAQITYRTPEMTTLPYSRLAASGTPDTVRPATGYFFTESNRLAVYEAEGYEDIDVYAVCGLEDMREGYLSFINPNNPPLVHRIKRLKGNLLVYLNNGAVTKGAYVRVCINVGSGEVVYRVPITASTYSASDNTFVKVGSLAVDLSDFQFGFTGISMCFEYDDSTIAAQSGLTYFGTNQQVGTIAGWGSDTIYAGTHSPSINFDGACYANPQPVTQFVGEEVAGGVIAIDGCHHRSCGPVAIYCYETYDPSLTYRHIWVQQPLYHPAPYVAYGTQAGRCYYNPTLASEEYTGTSFDNLINDYTSSDYCGKLIRYADCQDGNSQFTVVYPFASSPHAYVQYGSNCYSFQGTKTTFGTYAVVALGSVSAVTGCADVACTGSNANGNSYLYTDVESGLAVPVKFDRLDLGVAHYGASPETVDSGLTGFSSGQRRIIFKSVRELILRVTGTGTSQFRFDVGLRGHAKAIVIVRGFSEIQHNMSAGQTQLSVTVLDGDYVYLDLHRLSARNRNVSTLVTWTPQVSLPRVYKTSALTFSGSGTIAALGFCGLNNRQSYTVYDTLPYDGSASGATNPDCIVTAQGAGGVEYVVIRNRALGELRPQLPGGLTWYAGQSLASPITFRFYASRQVAGAHGEMDVWLSVAGSFPAYWKATPYRILASSGGYRMDSQLGDTTRNTLRIPTTTDLYIPKLYASDAGEVISVSTDDDVNNGVFLGSTLYTSVSRDDYGISSRVHVGDFTGLGATALVGTQFLGATNGRGMAYCSSTDEIWVADYSSTGRAMIFNPNTKSVVTTVTLTGSLPYFPAYEPNTDRLYFTTAYGHVNVINPQTRTVETVISLPTQTWYSNAATYSALTEKIYVGHLTSTGLGSECFLTQIDPITKTIDWSKSCGLGGIPARTLDVLATNEIYLVNQGGTCYVYNISTDTVTALPDLPYSTLQYAAYSPQYNKVYWQSDALAGSLVEYDPFTRMRGRIVSLPNGGRGVFYHPLRHRLYVGVVTYNGIKVVNAVTMAVAASVPTSSFATEFVYHPSTRLSFLTSYFFGNYIQWVT